MRQPSHAAIKEGVGREVDWTRQVKTKLLMESSIPIRGNDQRESKEGTIN